MAGNDALLCRTYYLETFSFQAPAFYAALDYQPAATIRGFPAGIVKYLMVRREPVSTGGL